MKNSINKENLKNLEYIKKLVCSNNFKNISHLPGFSDKQICVNFWLFRGWTIKAAKEKISKIQSENSLKYVKKRKENPENYIGVSPNQIEYWIKRNYSEKYAKQKIKERQATFSLEKCILKYGIEKGTKRWQQRQNQWQNNLNSKLPNELERIRLLKSTTLFNFLEKYGEIEGKKKYFLMMFRRKKTGLKNGTILSKKQRTQKEKYYRKVWNFTLKNDLSVLIDYEKRGINFHLDHKISINYGLRNNINPNIIGSIDNLQILSAKENIQKGVNCYSKLKGKIYGQNKIKKD